MAIVVFCDECAEYQIYCDEVGIQVLRDQFKIKLWFGALLRRAR
jgi:hypothetical protein